MEDNPADAGLVREALEQHRVSGELLVVTDGERAIQVIEEIDSPAKCPNLFIIDLNLPRLHGREVLARLHMSLTCRTVPVIILSSSDSPRDRDDAMHAGVSRYLSKPSRLEEFIALGAVFKSILAGPAT